MRSIYLPLVATAVFAFCIPQAAQANDFSIAVQSRYVDAETFNQVYSSTPQLRLEGTIDVNEHLYVAGYIYTGFSRPFRDKSSEAGIAVGGSWDLHGTTASVEVGRYANFGGRGLGAGDWYATAAVEHGRLTASASILRGEDRTALLRVEYRLPVTNRLSIAPSAVYLTAYHQLNPGVTASYSVNRRFSIDLVGVAPRDEVTRRRSVAFALRLAAHF